MACKSCGASKRIGRFCAYCRNPVADQPNIHYIDVSDYTPQEAAMVVKWYSKVLESEGQVIWPVLRQTPICSIMFP